MEPAYISNAAPPPFSVTPEEGTETCFTSKVKSVLLRLPLFEL